ncbi:hypothetical protein [Nonomuraea sp. NEAU-A123]|uniref:hypothetical protein n=1 Tax=Nonomuraea sp. NEAU-A123 TaxID=2839649 RepID=UPI001BE448A1|nr:hypothetical protein [Nonomuraea sp. NEAU-A123]MBT2224993.1 hypothetical protein [Nonomuraea sp. NEAU-A123]
MRTRKWLAAAFLLPLALGGCAVPGLGPDHTVTPSSPGSFLPPPNAPSANPATPAEQQPTNPQTTASQATDPQGSGALAKATFGAGTPTSADVLVLSLKRRGKLLDLVLSITPHSEKGETYISVEEFTGAGPTAITLVDSVNLKRYLVVRDSQDQPLQPAYWILKMEEAAIRTYTFPAPEGDVTSLDVSIGGWPPFRDVPVTS